MDLAALSEVVLAWLKTTGLAILIILIVVGFALLLARLIINRVFATLSSRASDGEARKRTDTLSSLVMHAARVAILAIAFVMILGELGVKIGPVLAAAGIVGVAVGFGAQSLVKDVLAGFFILLEDQIRVGDVVQLDGLGGLVEQVNLRMTILRDLSGNVHFVRNGDVKIITNMTKNFSYYLFNIGVAYREDVDEVMDVVREIGAEMQKDESFSKDILEPIEILGVDQFADSAVIIKARIKTQPIRQWAVGREFNRRMKKTFDARGIEIPFPHVTLYMGQDKDGAQVPMNVQMTQKQGSGE